MGISHPHIVNPVQDTEDSCLMINIRCLHKLTYNSHYKGDIRSSGSELYIWIYGTVNGPAITHTSLLQDIKSIFSLRDTNSFLGLSDLYAKKTDLGIVIDETEETKEKYEGDKQ
ncbi:hypothetical protein CR513_25523, partial [Mucuna pruriens]